MGITGKTKVVGLFGYPVAHSFSPQMHNAAFRQLSLDYCYVPFPVNPDRICEAAAAVRALSLAGVNVTVPHKQGVIAYLDELSSEARLIGAVNTIVNKEGRLVGYNTDGQGFVRSLRTDAGFDPKGKSLILLGAGGAARGVAVQLALAGTRKITIVNRTPKKAEEIVQVINEHTQAEAEVLPWTAESLAPAVRAAAAVVNTTSLGMHPREEEAPPLETDLLVPGTLVADLVYNPVRTLFLQKAEAAGCQTLSGLGMLLHQGAIAFELWTGCTAPIQVMRDALTKELKN